MDLRRQFGLASVLVDNTTLFGARRALEAWPSDPADWNSDPLAVDLRALMDTLEMIVLHKELVVDGSSRNYLVWPDLSEAPGPNAVLRDTHLLPDPAVQLAVLGSAVESLSELVLNGGLDEERKRIRQNDPAAILPSVYADPRDFFNLTTASFPGPRTAPVKVLRPLVELLEQQPADLAAYATFSFRGIYYQQLAHYLCISYQPHSWRARILAVQTEKPFQFTEYAFSVVEEVRAEMTNQLNAEFGGLVFTGEFPVLASYIVGQARRRGDLIPIARRLRGHPQVQAFRRWVHDLNGAVAQKTDLRRVNDASLELRELLAEMRKELRIGPGERRDEPGAPMTIKVGVPGIASMETELAARLPPEWRGLVHRRPHLLFLKDLMRKSVELGPFATVYSRLDP